MVLAFGILALAGLDIAISVLLFISVTLLIVSVFNQPGEIHLSAQREAALATGHSDRRTVFEVPLLRPILWVLLSISHRLAMPKSKQWIRRTLVAAGSPNYYTPEEYLALSIGVGVVLAALLEMFYAAAYGDLSLILLIFGLGGGIALNLFSLYDQASRRLREISRRVPYSLDLIALAMGAGATFTEAVHTVVRERSDDPLNVELRTLLVEIELGSTRKQALINLSSRIPLESLRSIIASVVQAEELGSPLREVLHDQATLLRLRRSFEAENKAAVAAVRILIPCLLLVIAVMLAIFGPAMIRIIRGGLLS